MRTQMCITKLSAWLLTLSIATVILVTNGGQPIYAHEGREVGDYNLVVGFKNEPAYEGLLNAVSLIVTYSEHVTGERSDTEADIEESHGEVSDSMTADVMMHGVLFVSAGLGKNEEFEFHIEDDMAGIEIPYHIHPGNYEGIIAVSDSEETSDEQVVMISDDGLMPSRLEVNVGDMVLWKNHSGFSASVMSGTLSSMSGGAMADMDHVMETEMNQRVPGGRVAGLSLKSEITHLSTNISKTMDMLEVQEDPGHYLAEFIPTATGDYSVRFIGDIEGVAVDETFQSGPETFDTVQPADPIQFPNVLPSGRELENATRGALDTARTAESSASDAAGTANLAIILAIVGISAGIVGIAVGIAGLITARQRA